MDSVEITLMANMHSKAVIVTGAGSGIGRATALALADAGADVIVNARSREMLDALVADIEGRGRRAIAVVGDVAAEETAVRLVEAAEHEFGGLDAAFNNAGTTGEMAPITDLSRDAWDHTLAVNLTGIFLGLKHQAPAIAKRGGGGIVCSSSTNGVSIGFAGMAAYGAAKAGITGLVKAAAIELAPLDIRINTIVLGGIDTPSNLANRPGAGPEIRSRVEGAHVLKRLARPDEVAAAALFLLSDESSFITGSSIFVDGGLTISRG